MAKEVEHELIFLEDPAPTLAWIDGLLEPYPYPLNLELKPFQVKGFNFFKHSHADIFDMSTGTGKATLGVAKANYLIQEGLVDKVVVVSKAHARINWQREFMKVASLESTVIGFYCKGEKRKFVQRSGTGQERREFRAQQYLDNQIVIINYEKFRDDEKELRKALKNKRVQFLFDEMPTKLKSTGTTLYPAVRRTLKLCSDRYCSLLSATPIENIPEDIRSCVRLISLESLPETVQEFRKRYVRSWSFWDPEKVELWDTEKLRELGMRLAHITYKASKYTDPEIAAQFPIEHEEDIIFSLSSQDQSLYDAVLKDILSDYWDGSNLDNMLAKMQTLQLICNNPLALTLSDGELARKICEKRIPNDNNCVKLEVLREMIDTLEGKVVLFTMYNDLGARPLSRYLTQWGVSHVVFDGSTNKQQKAIDDFQNDSSIKVFLSSDRGSDSINLDAGSSVINVDLPWKYSTKLQRQNRINRITSLNRGIENVYYYNLVVANSIEERKQLLLSRKRAYLEAVGEASREQAEGISDTLTRGELFFLLTGE